MISQIPLREIKGAGLLRVWIGCLLLVLSIATAQALTLQDVIQKAVVENPEVQQRWHAYLETDSERDAAFGNYLPRLDFTMGRGREDRNTPSVNGDYTLNSRTLTLTQMLYDGFATRNEVRRFNHARRVRMFELHDATESVALESVRAYLDVLRYRQLVGLTEENYIRHRYAFDQIQQKVKAGVGRRVDLEQAAGRLALAESNLLTETSNLHDVSARFQRIVGDVPIYELVEPAPLKAGIPADTATALKMAQAGNPTLQAAIENVRSADAAYESRKAAYQPRLDLRLRRDRGDNISGISGSSDVNTAEVIFSWNLLNGFSDRARSRQYAEQKNVAKDVRDKTCRDIRQILNIAYNDIRKLGEQLVYLDQHQLSTEKARDAYRLQFDIGQRTLLDLLDSENELFQAKRAYVNAEWDLSIAYARTQAGMGRLLTALGVSRAAEQQLPELANWSSSEDAAERCPAEAPQSYAANKEALDARAKELMKETAAAPRDALSPIPLQREAPPAGKVDASATQERQLAEAVQGWAEAWSSKNLDAYLKVYGTGFRPATGGTREGWARERRRIISSAGTIQLDMEDLKIKLLDDTHAETRFRQKYHSANYRDVVNKTITWERIGQDWLIVGEAVGALKQ